MLLHSLTKACIVGSVTPTLPSSQQSLYLFCDSADLTPIFEVLISHLNMHTRLHSGVTEQAYVTPEDEGAAAIKGQLEEDGA